jgi:exopolysaccharide biosynthesis polyprenyl glycosylphosphotransferase
VVRGDDAIVGVSVTQIPTEPVLVGAETPISNDQHTTAPLALALLERDRRRFRLWRVPTTPIGSVIRRLLPRFLGDAASVTVGVAIFEMTGHVLVLSQILWAVGFFAAAVVIDATHNRIEWNYVEEFVVSLKTSFLALVLTAGAGFLAQDQLSRTLFLSVALAMVVAKPVMAVAADRLTAEPIHSNDLALVVCGDEEYGELETASRERVRRSLRWARVWDGDGGVTPPGFVGQRTDLVKLCRELNPGKVVFGKSHALDPAFLQQVTEVNEMGISVRSFGRSFAEEYGRVPIMSLDTSWFLFDIAPLHRLGYRLGRRVVDFVAGIAASVVLLALLPLLAAAVKLDSSGPVFYTQARVGQRGRIFTIFKIRTMRSSAEPGGPLFAQKRDGRVTRLGRLLRRSRIDELPQAINLLKGDMTLIGPRPERPEWVEEFEVSIPFYDKRHLVKPGLTGWAQVHEGYGSSLEDAIRKLERDLYYVRHRSLGLDLRILMATVARVLRFAGQ